MKKAPLIIAILLAAVSAQAESPDVNVSVSVGQPGFYGRIDIGNAPRPQVIYARPIVVRPAPAHVVHEPIYLHVPPGHAKKWSRYCHRYNACNRPVYFVRDKWYNKVYVPHYRAHHRGPGHDYRHDGRQGGKPDRRGNGHGHGNDRR